ncbi:hypothetical protein Pelo_14811 [Pelomyxa schiedti]|nr:hypothetical protein Pelo_14811 [Pelomyxa schiedti]
MCAKRMEKMLRKEKELAILGHMTPLEIYQASAQELVNLGIDSYQRARELRKSVKPQLAGIDKFQCCKLNAPQAEVNGTTIGHGNANNAVKELQKCVHESMERTQDPLAMTTEEWLQKQFHQAAITRYQVELSQISDRGKKYGATIDHEFLMFNASQCLTEGIRTLGDP